MKKIWIKDWINDTRDFELFCLVQLFIYEFVLWNILFKILYYYVMNIVICITNKLSISEKLNFCIGCVWRWFNNFMNHLMWFMRLMVNLTAEYIYYISVRVIREY